MQTVVVSPKFQVLLPKEIRRSLGIKPGERLVAVERKGLIELIPVGNIKSARGMARWIGTKGLRDESERFG